MPDIPMEEAVSLLDPEQLYDLIMENKKRIDRLERTWRRVAWSSEIPEEMVIPPFQEKAQRDLR